MLWALVVAGLSVFVDKRITLGAFKKELERHVGASSENFKVSLRAFHALLNTNLDQSFVYEQKREKK